MFVPPCILHIHTPANEIEASLDWRHRFRVRSPIIATIIFITIVVFCVPHVIGLDLTNSGEGGQTICIRLQPDICFNRNLFYEFPNTAFRGSRNFRVKLLNSRKSSIYYLAPSLYRMLVIPRLDQQSFLYKLPAPTVQFTTSSTLQRSSPRIHLFL